MTFKFYLDLFKRKKKFNTACDHHVAASVDSPLFIFLLHSRVIRKKKRGD